LATFSGGYIKGKSMLKVIAKNLRSMNPWHFLWIAVLLSEILTFLISSFQSYVLWGFISHEVLLVGAIDALFVPVVVAPIVIYFAAKTKEIERANDQLLEEVKERRKAQDELKKEKTFTESALNVLQETFFVFDADGRFLRWNEAIKTVTGYGNEEISSMKPTDLFPEEERRRVTEAIATAINMGHVRLETVIRTKDGRQIPFMFAGSVLKNDEGRIIGISGTGTDISDSKRAGEALKESERKYRNLIETAHDLIWSVNAEGRITFINEAARRLYGYSPEELIGKSFADVISPEHVERDMDLFRKFVVHGEGIVNYETTLISTDGIPVVLSTNAALLRDDEGNVLGVMATSKDITAYRRAEEALKASSTRLRSLSSQLSLIEERERRKIADELHDQIGQYLALAKIKSGELRASPAFSVDLVNSVSVVRELIDKAIQYTRSLTAELSSPLLYELGLEAAVQALTEQFQKKYGLGIDFRKKGHHKALSEKTLVVLYKAVRELLINIIKHARADKATVSVWSGETDVRVSVEDDGIGFDVSKIDAPGEDNKFGLFNIRERVESIGGEFTIESRPGYGTRVFLVVPLDSTNPHHGK
jgi:PAS domain S-box-containing protein